MYRPSGGFPCDGNSSNRFAQQNHAFRSLPGGTTAIKPGDHLPLTPKQTCIVFVDYQVTPSLLVNLYFVAIGGSFARGNENNAHHPDGTC